MEYKSLFGFYWFGTCVRFLQDARPNTSIHGTGCILWNLEQLFSNFSTLGLRVTERFAHDKLDTLIAQLKEQPEDAQLGSANAATLQTIMQNLRDILKAEIQGIGAYSPTPKRLDLNRLLENVASLFAPSVFENLPPIAQYDLSEAGKCIAFERPTAAAFHILRATEDVLRFYYTRMVRSGRIGSLMWGPLVTDLRKRNLTKAYEALNNHLDNIRASFRNPTQHPEATYDIHEVQDLWAVCVDVINRMIRTLRDENRL